MPLLDDAELERSPTVANCRMNRERELAGSNGYSKELGFAPLGWLREQAARHGSARWLDLCCGTGRALVQAAEELHADKQPPAITIVGLDLVDLFRPVPRELTCLQLVTGPALRWVPAQRFDLITCVHGLHYVGDKLELLIRAASWLTDDGRFVANLDLQNFRHLDGRPARLLIAAELRRLGFTYESRHKRVRRDGPASVTTRLHYVGADDQAGPNSTGQPAVDSHYEIA
jgi:SAM-dependent methyltransferase